MTAGAEVWLLDANVLLRFLTMDVPEQGITARDLLARAGAGQVRLRMTTMAFAEVVWVLEKVYRWQKGEIAAGLAAALSLPGLDVDRADVLAAALPAYALHNVDLSDAYQSQLAAVDGVDAIVSYHRDFDRLPGPPRREP